MGSPWDGTIILFRGYIMCCAACFRSAPTAPRRYISSIYFLSTMIYTISCGTIHRKRLCSGIFSELLCWTRNSLEEFLWDINILHPPNRTRFQPQALWKRSTAVFCGHTVKITGSFCIQSGYLQDHIFCSRVDLTSG